MTRSMPRRSFGRLSAALLTALLWTLHGSSLHAAWRLAPRVAEPADFYRFMSVAEQQRGAEQFSASARSYAAAYRALSDTERLGLMGEIALDNALMDYQAAYERDPEDLALLDEPAMLLTEFLAQRTKAHEEGLCDAVPQRLVDELARLHVEFEIARPRRRTPAPAELELAPTPAEPSDEPEQATPAEVPRPTPSDRPRWAPRRRANAVLLATGVSSLAGGTALIAGGAWNFVQLSERRRARLTALDEGDYTEQARLEYEGHLAAWQRRSLGIATGLVVSGAVLSAAGIGLTTWGAVRMRRTRRHPRAVSIALRLVPLRDAAATLALEF